MAIRSTRQYAEVLSDGEGNARVTRQYAEVLSNGTGAARVTRQYIEVLTPPPPAEVDAGASDTLTLTATATKVLARTRGAGDTLTLVESAIGGLIRVHAAADTFVVTEYLAVDLCRVAADAISLSDAASYECVRSCWEAVSLSEEVRLNFSIGISSSDPLVLADEASTSRSQRVRAADAITVVDAVDYERIKPVRDLLSLSETLAYSLILGVHDTLSLTDVASTTVEHSRSATDTLVLTDTAAEYFDTSADTLELAEAATVNRNFRVRAADTIALADTAGAFTLSTRAADTLALSDAAASNQFYSAATNDTLELTDTSTANGVSGIWAESVVEVLQLVFEDYNAETGELDIRYEGLQDAASATLTRMPSTAADSLYLLSERAVGIVIRVDAIPASCSDTLTLSDTAWATIATDAADVLVITEVADVVRSKLVTETLVITDAATVLQVRGLSASDTIDLVEALVYEAPYAGVEHQYHPFVGSGPMPTAIAGVTTATGFRLCYPPAGPFTDTLALRNPRLGNRDRVQMNRISRETRGGTLVVFADSIWPKIQTQIYQFEGLSWDEACGFMEFLDNHLGLEIGLLDHEHRYWRGVVVIAEEPVVHDGKRGYALGFEFEGEIAVYPS